jgi:hypothetical protein
MAAASPGNWPGQVDLWIDEPVTQTAQYRRLEVVGVDTQYIFYDLTAPTTTVVTITAQSTWNNMEFYTRTVTHTLTPGIHSLNMIVCNAGNVVYPGLRIGVLAQTGTVTTSLSFVGQ